MKFKDRKNSSTETAIATGLAYGVVGIAHKGVQRNFLGGWKYFVF